MRKLVHLLMIVAGSALALSANANGSAGRGLELSKTCAACHGPDGNGIGNPQYPIIAGQYQDYLAQALVAYRNGERTNVIMNGFAKTLSDQDIADLTAYFSSNKSKLDDLANRK